MAFALAFVVLGWIVGHSITYEVVGLLPHDHHGLDHNHAHDGHLKPHVHGYMDGLGLAGGAGLVLAFGLALRTFFRHGSFGEWLHEGGISGTRKQVALATSLPTSVFVLVEHLERLAAGTGTTPSTRLLVVGVLVQLVLGLACLALVRFTFRVAEKVIVSIARGPLVRPARQETVLALEDVVLAHPLCPMAGLKAGRAPPSSPTLS